VVPLEHSFSLQKMKSLLQNLVHLMRLLTSAVLLSCFPNIFKRILRVLLLESVPLSPLSLSLPFASLSDISLIKQIYGAYKLRIYGTSFYFFVTNNIFLNPNDEVINEKYDLKGSWVKRNSTPPQIGQRVTCTHCNQKYIFLGKKKQKQKSYKYCCSLPTHPPTLSPPSISLDPYSSPLSH
jgi:hypothetical protein